MMEPEKVKSCVFSVSVRAASASARNSMPPEIDPSRMFAPSNSAFWMMTLIWSISALKSAL